MCTETPVPPGQPPPDPGTTPPNLPPTAAIAVGSGVTVLDVWSFDTTGTFDPEGNLASLTVVWGDGTPNTSLNPAFPSVLVPHSFPAPGTYAVRLTAVDGAGLAQTAQVTINVLVSAVPPVAALTFVSGAFTGSPVTLSTAGSSDPDGAITSWIFNPGDGSASQSNTGVPPATLQHTYATPGTWTATFTVFDAAGLFGTVSMPILQQAPAPGNPPVTTFSLTSGTLLGDSFVFALNGTDPEAGAMTWTLEYGDGTSTSGTGADFPASRARTYVATGSFTATFRVTDAQALTTTKTVAVVVAAVPDPDPDPVNQSPTCSLSQLEGQFAGEVFTIQGTVTDLDNEVVPWTLTYGDGSATVVGAGQPAAPFTHTYAGPGTYVVTLTATDTGGLVGTAALSVVVQAPPATNQPPAVALEQISGFYAGDTYVFGLSAVDTDGGISAWLFNPGDGSAPFSSTGTLPATRDHRYTVVGTYTATLQATDTGGLVRSATVVVAVATPPPPPTPGDYPYWDLLTPRSDRLYAWPLRSSAEIVSYPKGQTNGLYPVSYDPAMDALLTHINFPVTGKVNPEQLFLPLVIPFGVSWFMTWDYRLNSGWDYLGVNWDRGRKSYRFDCAPGAEHPIWLAPKDFFQEGANHVPSALSDVRNCNQTALYVIPPTVRLSNELITPQVIFYAEADRWTRRWYYYDAVNQELSIWTADVVQGIVQQMHKDKYGFPSTGLKQFRIEWNTSQSSFPNTDEKVWNRNVVVLTGLSYATAVSLLSTVGL